jgi:hypothetical protein
MKILRCIHSLNPVIGGPLESVKQLSRVLARRGHKVEVVSLDAPTDPWLREFPTTVHALGPGHGSYGYSARLVPWLKERHAQYDAVLVHGIWQYNSFGTWRALHKAVTPALSFHTECSIRGSTALIRLSISRSCSTGPGGISRPA